MYKINTDKRNLRKFSITMFLAFTIIGTLLFLKHRNSYIWFYLVGLSLLLVGILATNLLRPIYTTWMRLSLVLAWINTRLILAILFYLVFTPIGLGMRLFGVDLLDRKIEKAKESYWKEKEKKELSHLNYERQF